MSRYPNRIETRNDLADAIVAATQVGALGEAILMRALYRREICHWQILPGSSNAEFKRFAAATKGQPTVVVIPGDDYSDRLPEDWPSAPRAVAWAAAIVVHAAGAEDVHYHSAIAAAKARRRVLLIECSTATVAAWTALVSVAKHKPNVLLILPTAGSHPLPLPKVAMQ